MPNLLQLASELEEQRNHVLGKPHRESQDDPLDAELAEQRRDEPGELDNGFESLGADAELDQVIFDGSSFGTATPAGSDEEADYLGIPGLLDAGQMRDLLSRRQDEQLQKRTASGETAPPSTHGQLRELRRELNALVSATHHSRASRTAGSTTNCVAAAAARRWRPPPAINCRRASRRCAT